MRNIPFEFALPVKMKSAGEENNPCVVRHGSFAKLYLISLGKYSIITLMDNYTIGSQSV